jgi:hypothetical protein
MSYQKRTIAPHLARLATQYPVVTLTGPRQSGKSTLTGRQQFSLMAGVSQSLAGRTALLSQVCQYLCPLTLLFPTVIPIVADDIHTFSGAPHVYQHCPPTPCHQEYP